MPPKLLHVIGQLVRGGAEGQLTQLVSSLAERNWPQAVVTFAPGQAWDHRIRQLGVPLFGIPRSPNKISRLWQFNRAVRQTHPAIVHSWSGHTNVYLGFLFSRQHLFRIVSLRGNPTIDNHTGHPRATVPFAYMYACVDCVVSNSAHALKSAEEAGVGFRRAELVDNMVLALGRAHPGADTQMPRIVAAGALKPLKAYEVLFYALGQLAKNRSFELKLAGDGPERHHLQELATSLGIGHRVQFLGEIDDVPTLMASAHLLVHPSRSEGMSNTILEAMAEGLPVIATTVGDTPRLITHEVNGLLVPPDQPDLLAAQISRLLADAKLRQNLGREGFDLVQRRFGTAPVTAQYEAVYKSMVAA